MEYAFKSIHGQTSQTPVHSNLIFLPPLENYEKDFDRLCIIHVHEQDFVWDCNYTQSCFCPALQT